MLRVLPSVGACTEQLRWTAMVRPVICVGMHIQVCQRQQTDAASMPPSCKPRALLHASIYKCISSQAYL